MKCKKQLNAYLEVEVKAIETLFLYFIGKLTTCQKRSYIVGGSGFWGRPLIGVYVFSMLLFVTVNEDGQTLWTRNRVFMSKILIMLQIWRMCFKQLTPYNSRLIWPLISSVYYFMNLCEDQNGIVFLGGDGGIVREGLFIETWNPKLWCLQVIKTYNAGFCVVVIRYSARNVTMHSLVTCVGNAQNNSYAHTNDLTSSDNESSYEQLKHVLKKRGFFCQHIGKTVFCSIFEDHLADRVYL